MVENAKKCRLYTTFPYVLCHKSLKDIYPRIGCHNKERLRLVYTRGHQPGAHRHQIARKDHVGRPRACSK